MGGGYGINYYQIVAIVLFGIGFTTLFLNRNLVKKIIGLNILDTAVYLFLASVGYIEGRGAPIIGDGATDPSLYINPIPSGLILTGIVISVSMTAFSLALIVQLYKKYDTLNLDEMIKKSREEKA